jgi:hypothetical protein
MSQPQNVPPRLDYAPPPAGPDLRVVATRQKGLIFCILAYLLAVAAQFALPEELRLLAALFALAVVVAAVVFVFMMALELYGVGIGIVMGVLTLIPLVGLIVLLIINGKATKLLRRHGIKVGLFGADSRQIPDPGQTPLRQP